MKKRILINGLALLLSFLFSVETFAGGDNNVKRKGKATVCKPKRAVSYNLPPRGGRQNMPNGIEGHKINFGFDLGGSLAMIDALNREKSYFGAKGTIFIHAIIPKTNTFAIGFEGGATYLMANEAKYKETLIASSRDGALATDKEAKVTVGNWLLPTAQVSFVGNFHPAPRFNIQLKGNLGAVLAMTPKYEAEYYVKEIQNDGSYAESKYHFLYNNSMAIGLSATVGTKLLYALSAHSEFTAGLDWTYMRFSYEKGYVSPIAGKVNKELTQFGIFDLHIGFAFSF